MTLTEKGRYGPALCVCKECSLTLCFCRRDRFVCSLSSYIFSFFAVTINHVYPAAVAQHNSPTSTLHTTSTPPHPFNMPFSSNTPLHPSHLNPQVQEQAEVDESSTTNHHSPHGQGKDKGKAQDRSESGYAHPHSSTSSHPHLAGPYHPESTAVAPYHSHSTSASPFHPSPSGSVSASPSTSGFHLPSFHIPRVGSLGRIPTSSSSWAHVNDHPDNHPYPPSAFSSALPSANNSATNLPETLNLPQAPPSLKYNTITDIQNKNSGTSSSTSMGFRDRDRHEREHKDKHHDSHSKEKPHLDIILDAPFLTLRGTGPDVEPTTLSGHVALFLTEATSVKEITLQFRGKAKIPMPATESCVFPIINNTRKDSN